MTHDGISATVERVLTAFNVGDLDVVASVFALDSAVEVGPEFSMTGPSGALQVIAYFSQFYEHRFQRWRVFSHGGEAVVEAQMVCKYISTYPGHIEAQGQEIIVPAAFFVTFKDGLVSQVSCVVSSFDWAFAV
ncbi:MAG TPA: hypothetical protein DEO85_01185 [Maritimibacter sp.]|nr:hypothetical protein [Maritimibacter sp.]